jgi:predicted alpha/beta-fold hydrolase
LLSNLNDISPFTPPLWCINAHVQTIAGTLFSRPGKPAFKTIEISTSDGDFLELNVKEGQKNSPAVVLIHGLEGSAGSRYIFELTHVLGKRDYSVVAVNLRGCGSRMNRRRRFYHSGGTDDLTAVFTWVKEHFPSSKMGAAGFSLGGNVLIKSLAEEGAAHPVQVAAAVSVPYDLYDGSQRIQKGFTRIYERMFVKSMNKKLEEKRKAYPDLPVFEGSTLYEFDDQVTAPIHRFKDAKDYYLRCSSGQFLDDMKTRVLLIHSKDDPLCPFTMVPMKSIKQNPCIDYIITKHGGHVGFWSRPYGWLNRIIANYFSKNFD